MIPNIENKYFWENYIQNIENEFKNSENDLNRLNDLKSCLELVINYADSFQGTGSSAEFGFAIPLVELEEYLLYN